MHVKNMKRLFEKVEDDKSDIADVERTLNDFIYVLQKECHPRRLARNSLMQV